MMTMSPITRRSALGLAVASGVLLVTGAEAAPGPLNQISAAASGVDPGLVDRASTALSRHRRAISANDIVAIADFGTSSAAPRFHLIDLVRGETTTLLVAHGL